MQAVVANANGRLVVQSSTYAQTYRAVSALADLVPARAVVGICLPGCPLWYCVELACITAGGTSCGVCADWPLSQVTQSLSPSSLYLVILHPRKLFEAFLDSHLYVFHLCAWGR
jgi:long-subunit acyl-CoA synthetase (AMP-forming)